MHAFGLYPAFREVFLLCDEIERHKLIILDQQNLLVIDPPDERCTRNSNSRLLDLRAPRPFSSQPSVCCPPLHGVSAGRVTKIAIDIRAREGENKRHEESLAGVLPASGRLHGEEAAGCSDSASNTEPVATAHCRTHRTLCSRKTGKCQHSDLQLSARDHRDRFKNGAHKAGLQENERGKMRLALEGA
jgi:hypothetical protein